MIANNKISAHDTSKVLSFLLDDFKISLDEVQEKMNAKKFQEILNNHPYKIWQGNDNRWRTYLPDISKSNGRKMIVKTHLKDLENHLISFYENQDETKKLEDITLKELYPQWLEYKRLHTEAETYITRINSDWNTYYSSDPIIDIPIKQLTKIKLDTWAHTKIKQHAMSKNKYYNVTVIMRQALLYAVDLGIIECSPFSSVKIDGRRLFRKVKKKPSHTQVFFKHELQFIYQMALEDFYNKVKVYQLSPLALLFQFQTGLRIGEVCVVRYEDIESTNYIHIQRMLRRDTKEVVEHTKGYEDRKVYLTEQAKKIILLAKERQKELGVDSNGYIFSINGLPLTERSISDLYTKYCNKLGIIHKSSHKSRKTFISTLIGSGVNINSVRETAGHSDERTTLGNYVFDTDTESERTEKIEKALDYFNTTV